jgi:hypothetical protein
LHAQTRLADEPVWALFGTLKLTKNPPFWFTTQSATLTRLAALPGVSSK